MIGIIVMKVSVLLLREYSKVKKNYRNGTNAVEYLKPARSPDGIQGFLKQFSKFVKKVIKG
jgi:hypothetical protein